MTALDLPAIRALHATHYQGFEYGDDIAEGGDEEVPEDYERHFCHEDGEDWPCPAFIAAAPSIVTQLLAVVEAQQAKLDAVAALADTPDQTLVKPKGDKIFYVEAHRIRAALIGEGQ